MVAGKSQLEIFSVLPTTSLPLPLMNSSSCFKVLSAAMLLDLIPVVPDNFLLKIARFHFLKSDSARLELRILLMGSKHVGVKYLFYLPVHVTASSGTEGKFP